MKMGNGVSFIDCMSVELYIEEVLQHEVNESRLS